MPSIERPMTLTAALAAGASFAGTCVGSSRVPRGWSRLRREGALMLAHERLERLGVCPAEIEDRVRHRESLRLRPDRLPELRQMLDGVIVEAAAKRCTGPILVGN